ncbi:MAG: HlyD family efflux transporter periplasmic adaptor subunit, partial [Holophagales bacterium]|nr:HlyD family efflux transporter periplasmic adaptor subunit [Holophagales bacterium]
LEELREELEQATQAWLRDPSDPETARAVGSLEERMRQAQAHIDERSIRAPREGIVGELEVLPGQAVTPGEVLLSLVDEEPKLELLVFFSGQDRPRLRPGLPVRFSPQGFRHAGTDLVIDRIDGGILGPSKARAVLGATLAEVVPLSGPVTLARVELSAEGFESHGREHPYYEGLLGFAEARVRSQPIVIALFPGLEGLFGSFGRGPDD